MTDSSAQKLQLAPLYKEALTVLTFAARKPHNMNSYVVNCNPSGLFLVSSRIGYILTGNYSYPTKDGGTHSRRQSSSFLIMTQVNCTVPVVN